MIYYFEYVNNIKLVKKFIFKGKTLVIKALRKSRGSRPSISAVILNDFSVAGVILQPPFVLSGSSSKLIFPRCKTAATVL